jgi:single-strand DNA-binding protein
MNNLRNSITLIGRLGNDPENKTFENGKCLTKISLATNEVYKNQNGEKVEQTQWHKCIAWGKTAELMAQLLSKGKNVAVRGKMTYRSYQDKEGNKRTMPEIVVEEFVSLSEK